MDETRIVFLLDMYDVCYPRVNLLFPYLFIQLFPEDIANGVLGSKIKTGVSYIG
jgi:hypothetical protein